MITTTKILESIADAVQAAADDHNSRLGRIEAHRQHLAVLENRISLEADRLRKSLEEFTALLKEQFEALIALDLAELSELDGKPEPRPFATIAGGKSNGAERP